MASPVAVHHFASFAEISASIDSIKCIHPILTENHRRCRNSIDKEIVFKISTVLNDIRNAVGTTTLPVIVRRFALLKCCPKVHQTRLRNSHLLNNLVQRWVDELDVPDKCQEKDIQVTEGRVLLHRYPTRSRAQHYASGGLCTSITLSQGASQITSLSTDLAVEFAPYVRNPRYTVKAKLEEPLTKLAWKTGTVYMFTRPSSPGFVKIGYTTMTVADRMKRWEKSCRYAPVVQHAIYGVPHVYRVEQLIHTELKEYWRKEKRCKHNPDCPKQHQEWFEIAVENAKRIMNKWVEWMQKARTYNDSGLLEPEWVQVCRWARDGGKAMTAQALLNVLTPPQNEILSARQKELLADNTSREQPAHQASQHSPSRPSLNTRDLEKLSRLLEELSREIHVLSYQRRLRTPVSTKLSNIPMPAPGQRPLSIAVNAIPTIA